MENTMFASMLAIQKELKTIKKNKKGYSGTFADIENVWESIRSLINENGFVVYHEVTVEGVKTIALHESNQTLSSFIPFIQFEARISDKGKTTYRDSQEQGKEITYAKRYNISAIFNLIISDEDNDANREKGNYAKSEVDGTLAAQKLNDAKTPEEGNEIYKSLSVSERNTQEVIQAIASLKNKFKK